jgi:hypothetical protein
MPGYEAPRLCALDSDLRAASHRVSNAGDFQWSNHKRQILPEPAKTSAQDISAKGFPTGDTLSF